MTIAQVEKIPRHIGSTDLVIDPEAEVPSLSDGMAILPSFFYELDVYSDSSSSEIVLLMGDAPEDGYLIGEEEGVPFVVGLSTSSCRDLLEADAGTIDEVLKPQSITDAENAFSVSAIRRGGIWSVPIDKPWTDIGKDHRRKSPNSKLMMSKGRLSIDTAIGGSQYLHGSWIDNLISLTGPDNSLCAAGTIATGAIFTPMQERLDLPGPNLIAKVKGTISLI